MNKKITILLIDDHPVVRTGYRRLLESNSEMLVIGEADNAKVVANVATVYPNYYS
jgi:two-component system invasion response regulator UvrY